MKVVATSLKAPIFTLEHLKVTLWETRFLDPVLCIHSKICVLLCSRAFIELFTKLTHPPRHLGPWPQTQPMSGVFRKGGLNRMLLFKTGVRRAHWLKLKIFLAQIYQKYFKEHCMFEFDRQTHLCLWCPIPRIQPSLRPRSNPLAWFVVPIWSRATSPSPKKIQLSDDNDDYGEGINDNGDDDDNGDDAGDGDDDGMINHRL